MQQQNHRSSLVSHRIVRPIPTFVQTLSFVPNRKTIKYQNNWQVTMTNQRAHQKPMTNEQFNSS